MPKLDNDRWELFCHEYIKAFNGAQSYMAIYEGCSYDAARINASRLLTNANIQGRIAELMEERMAVLKVSAQDVLKHNHDYVMANMADLFDENMQVKHISEWPEIWQTMVSSIKVTKTEGGPVIEIKIPDKLKAMELLGKHVDVQAYREQVKAEHSFDAEVSDLMADASSAGKGEE